MYSLKYCMSSHPWQTHPSSLVELLYIGWCCKQRMPPSLHPIQQPFSQPSCDRSAPTQIFGELSQLTEVKKSILRKILLEISQVVHWCLHYEALQVHDVGSGMFLGVSMLFWLGYVYCAFFISLWCSIEASAWHSSHCSPSSHLAPLSTGDNSKILYRQNIRQNVGRMWHTLLIQYISIIPSTF